MDETRRNSMKLDIEAVRLSDNDRDQPTETYKQISEFNSNDKSGAQLTANMTREKGEHVEDGADEKMLSGDDKQQLARKDEVKFIASDRSNGDAKIDIGQIEKNFTGMTKDELMKYVNDPFWIRLRWIFFILFWLLWIAMLAGAILIILKAPKCSAPKPLVWFKEGPLVKLHPEIKVDAQLLEKLQSIETKGVIYQLPADKTYSVHTDEVRNHIKGLIENFKNTTVKVILDLTPNFVTTEDDLYKLAIANDTYRSAFIWLERTRFPNNWLTKEGNGSAWKEVKTQNYVLSQFGPNNIDLQLNDTFAKEKFKKVLHDLVELGVKGFRLANAKHYIIDKTAPDDGQSSLPNKIHTDYDFWTHSGTTFQAGIGQLLNEFSQFVSNETNGEGFLSVSENIERPEVFKNNTNQIGFDLPMINVLSYKLNENGSNVAEKLRLKLESAVNDLGQNVWIQWPYEKPALDKLKVGTSEYNIFLFLLPGVPVGTLDEFIGLNNTNLDEVKKLEAIRKSQSYQHGSFAVYSYLNDTVIAYSRLKSGNPGYFVVYNPSDQDVLADFSTVPSLPEQLTVELVSESYKNDQVKVPTKAIPVSAHSAVVLTYAPIKK